MWGLQLPHAPGAPTGPGWFWWGSYVPARHSLPVPDEDEGKTGPVWWPQVAGLGLSVQARLPPPPPPARSLIAMGRPWVTFPCCPHWPGSSHRTQAHGLSDPGRGQQPGSWRHSWLPQRTHWTGWADGGHWAAPLQLTGPGSRARWVPGVTRPWGLWTVTVTSAVHCGGQRRPGASEGWGR